MAKKTWIKIKRGILEPKHRRKLGAAWFLYFYMLDKTNWDDGVIYDWKDDAASQELEIPLATLRDHRRKLEDELYIQTTQKQYCLEIAIINWTNPREYSGKKYNEVPGDNIPLPQENQGDDIPLPQNYQGDTQGDTQGVEKSTLLHRTHRITLSQDHRADSPSDIQLLLEKITGLPPSGAGDIKAMTDIQNMNPLTIDIQEAVDWVVGQGNHIHRYSSLVQPIRIAIAKRVQKPKSNQDQSMEAIRQFVEESQGRE